LGFNSFLDKAEEVLDGRSLLLTLDEFEKLGERIRDGHLPENILATMRHLIQHRPYLSFLFAGVSELEALGPNWHSYFISVQPIKVSYLDEPSARRLITQPLPNWPLDVSDQVAGKIIRLTRCQPFLVQLLCSELVNWFNTLDRQAQPSPRRASLEDVDQAVERALDTGTPYFENLWAEAGELGQQALFQAAQSPSGIALPDSIPAQVLKRLKRLDLLEENDGRWLVQVELTRRWLAAQANRL
jgi:hypothetical protein